MTVIFVCKPNELLIKHYAVRQELSEYIHNGIDIDYYDPNQVKSSRSELRGSLSINESEIVVCIVAALRPEKQHGHLLDAGNILKKEAYLLRFSLLVMGLEIILKNI